MTLPLAETQVSSSVTVNGAAPVTYADVNPEAASEEGRRFARTWFADALPFDLEALRQTRRPSIPYQIDARLLTTSCRELRINPEDQLDYDARTALRNGFWDEFERLEAGYS